MSTYAQFPQNIIPMLKDPNETNIKMHSFIFSPDFYNLAKNSQSLSKKHITNTKQFLSAYNQMLNTPLHS